MFTNDNKEFDVTKEGSVTDDINPNVEDHSVVVHKKRSKFCGLFYKDRKLTVLGFVSVSVLLVAFSFSLFMSFKTFKAYSKVRDNNAQLESSMAQLVESSYTASDVYSVITSHGLPVVLCSIIESDGSSWSYIGQSLDSEIGRVIEFVFDETINTNSLSVALNSHDFVIESVIYSGEELVLRIYCT